MAKRIIKYSFVYSTINSHSSHSLCSSIVLIELVHITYIINNFLEKCVHAKKSEMYVPAIILNNLL